MNTIKPIRTEDDYEKALSLLGELIAKDPEPDTDESYQLDVLSTLIEDYESKVFPRTLPTPIEAIKFRMEQQNLKPADLVPFLGSRSRVSEILSGKRSLTVDMIRALQDGLGIPAEVLLQKPVENEGDVFSKWDKKLFNQMADRGYFEEHDKNTSSPVELLRAFFVNSGGRLELHALLRQSSYRSAPTTDRMALAAWANRVVEKANKVRAKNFDRSKIDVEFLHEVAKLSSKQNGPLLAQEKLAEFGIRLVIEPVFPKTRLDGAAILKDSNKPVIGMTLRHDRLDNFWFTLMHELAHIALHNNDDKIDLFFDELEETKGLSIEAKETEADELASEALVPTNKWEASPARVVPSPMAAISLAEDVGVHVAVIAGKIRYESGRWSYLNKIIGDSKVRSLFKDIDWDK